MDSEVHQVSSSSLQVLEGESLTARSNNEVEAPREESLTARSNDEVEAPRPAMRRKIRKRKSKSEVWGHYNKIVDADGKESGKCKYCGKLFSCNLKRIKVALRNHVRSCKDHPHNIETREALSTQIDRPHRTETREATQIDGENLGSPSGAWKFDELSIRKALCVMIIHDELPFKFVEGTGFKYFMAVACPMFHIPSRSTIQRDCYQLYLDEKLKLKKFLKESCQRVCLTTDTWSSQQRICYMCLTAHWIDWDWKLNKRILNFCPVSSHRGDDLARVVQRCLLDWGIDKVFTITVDNASSNDVMVNLLKRRFCNLGNNILQGKFLHVRCIAHIVNLLVDEGMKFVNISVDRVRGAVRYVRQSPSRLQKFRTCVEIEKIQCKSGLCLDVSTRWNSTYLMLNAAQKFEKAFDRFEEQDPFYIIELENENGVPSHDDWINVRRLCTFLHCFYNLILRVSGSLYVTSNNFFHEICIMYSLLQKWGKSGDVVFKSLAQKMQKKFDRYWGNNEDNKIMNMLIYVAVVLDPRYKMVYVEVIFKDMYIEEQSTLMVNKVKESMSILFNEYKNMYQVKRGHAIGVAQASHDMENYETQSADPRFRFKKLRAASGMQDVLTELDTYLSEKVEVDTELDAYLSEKLEADIEGFDILYYWKVNSSRFPILSRLARDVLAVPISIVASESAFSTGGRVLDCFRSSLTPKIVQSLLCAEDWLRAATLSSKITVEEDIADLDKIEAGLSGLVHEPTISEM